MTTFLFISFIVFAFARTLKFLQFYQQEGYSATDFAHFAIHGARLVDKRLSGALLIASIFTKNTYIFGALCLVASVLHKNPFTQSRDKKRFRLTARAGRIWATTMLITGGVAWFIPNVYLLILLIESFPLIIIIADKILSPVESLIKLGYYKQAEAKLKRIAPVVIGITGSFGKTSTKNILKHILGESALATDRSINTLYGIVAAINGKLEPHHKYFIAEVGTGAPGKVKKIVDLIKNKHAILTAVGNMHYEYFKDTSAVAREKFNIFNHATGIKIINALQVAPEYLANAPADAILLSGVENVRTTPNGTEFDFDGHHISAPVFGAYQANDIALAFLMAKNLGITPDEIIERLRTLPQTIHRQNVIKHTLGMTLIDDAYNSNKDGFLSAIDTARTLAGSGRAILVTPGMLELGAKHDEYHREVARRAAEKIDVVILVVPDRIRAFADEFSARAPGKILVCVSTFAAAEEWIAANHLAGDVLLYENDLADIYEEKIRI